MVTPPELGAKLEAVGRWGPKAGLSLADQAVASGAGFVLNILLARWLPPAEYGAFAVTFAAFLFLTGFQNALVLEPMLVLGPANHSHRLRTYLGALLWGQLMVSILAGIIGIGAAAAVRGPLGEPLIAMGLSLPATLLFWFVRRAGYTAGRPDLALRASCLYCGGLLALVTGLQAAGRLSAATAWGAMGLAGLLGGLALLVPQKWFGGVSPRTVREVAAEHGRYGWWLAVAAVLSAGVNHAQTVATAMFLGLEAAGALRAMTIFILPASHAVTALSLLALPALAADYGRGEPAALRRRGLVVTRILAAGAALYTLVLGIFAGPLERLAYGGHYAPYAGLAGGLGLVVLFSAAASGYSLILRAIQRPEHYLLRATAAGVSGLGAAWLLIPPLGLAGAVAATVIPYAVSAAVTYYLYVKWFPDR